MILNTRKYLQFFKMVLKMGDNIREAWLRRQPEQIRKVFIEQFAMNILLKNGLKTGN